MKISADLLGLNEFSLYVLEWNTSAVCCYQSLGFRRVKAPEVLEGLED